VFIKKLQRLSLPGFLTDRVFEYIGAHARRLKMLSIAFAGDSDLGLHHILSGCDSHKMEIRDCPFGDKALLANVAKLETMRSLRMSTCSLSFGACKLLSQKMPRLSVEVIDENCNLDPRQDNCKVEKLYLYRTVAGSRSDMPRFIWTIDLRSDIL
ncbi:protein transport inhibitor response 1, partial [Tanacetum coccineum]